MHTLAMYYMTKAPLEENPLLHSFVNGDDAFRNSRFKLIPYISKVHRKFMKSDVVEFSSHASLCYSACGFFVSSGFMDCQAECWKEGLLGGSNARSALFSWEKLFRGKHRQSLHCRVLET